MPPEVVEIADGELHQTTGGDFEYFNLFLGPLRAEEVNSPERKIGPYLVLDRTAPDALTLHALAPDNVSQLSYRLPIEPAGLQCIDGFFQLPADEIYTVGEFTTLNGQSFRRFGTLSDGSLIYYEQFGPLKKIPGTNGEFTHLFYRFRAVGHASDVDN